MKFVGLIGSTREYSYNRQLLAFIQKHFEENYPIDLIEIKDVPLFNESDDQTESPILQNIIQQIENADGVIISTPEINYSVPAGLKSILEWLSYKVHPLQEKPVMIIGASQHTQGSSRSQLHLRQILDSPGVNAWVLPGNEFLLSSAAESFDEQGNLKDQATIEFLENCLDAFNSFTALVNSMKKRK